MQPGMEVNIQFQGDTHMAIGATQNNGATNAIDLPKP